MVKILLSLLLVLSSLLPLTSQAFPATLTNSSDCAGSICYQYQKLYHSDTGWGTAAGTCAAMVEQAKYTKRDYPTDAASIVGSLSGSAPYLICNITWNYGVMGNYGLNSRVTSALYSCPVGTLSGSSCVCPVGQTDTGSTCVDPNVAKCTAKTGSVAGQYQAPHVIGVGSMNGTTYRYFCESSCLVDVDYSFGAGGFKSGTGAFTGATCTGSTSADGSGIGTSYSPAVPAVPGAAAPTPCTSGQYSGTVNGASVCINPNGDKNTIQAEKTTTATNPVSAASAPGSGGSTTTKDSTVCTGAKCTTTTTTTTTNAAGVSTVMGQTKTEDVGDFCKTNPSSVACKDFNLGELSATPVTGSTVALSINKAAGFGPESGTCPAPKTAVILGITISMPFTLLCDFANLIRPLLIGFAYLSAALTFFGFAKR